MSDKVVDPSRSRFDADGDEIVQHLFSTEDLQLSPEEYVARHCHQWALFSFHLYRYRDPVLGTWVRRVGEIIFNEEEVERCRRRFLSAEEIATVRKQIAEGF